MKTIGLIGGMSWESSKLYYELINQQVNKELGGSHSAESVLVTVQYDKIERLSFKGKWDEIGKMLKTAAKQVEAAGADMILLCTNTMHLVSDAITEHADIPFLHIADATGAAIKEQKLKKVALLGTRFTMEKDFYRGLLAERYQLETIIPTEDERQIVHDIIYGELVRGKINSSSRERCKEIIGNLQRAGAEGVILGCTELPLLLSESDVELPLFDTTKIHASKAVDWALQKD